MSDSREPGNSSPVDSDTFHEWVEHTASARGVDEQELLNQLVSAFWVLDEMSGVTGDSDPFGTATGTAPDRSDSDPSAAGDGGAGRLGDAGSIDDADAFLGADASDPEPDAAGSPSPKSGDDPAVDPTDDDGDRGVDSGTEGSAGSDDAADETAAGGADGELAEEIRALRESLHTQFEMMQTVGELRRQLSDLSLDVENQRSRQDQFTDRISDDLTRLHSRVEELEARTGESQTANADAVDRLETELREDIASLESTHREFESWIDEEFDEIEGLFEHLIGVTDELDERLATVETEMETVRERGTEREQLRELRRTAQRSGIDSAVCDSCEAGVDVSMLDEPRCPECDARFEGVEPATGWNPFAKSTLRTEPEPPAPPEGFESR